MRLPEVLAVCLAASLAVACGRDEPRERAPVRLGEELSPHRVTERRARMHDRIETVDVARRALARGDLDAARTVATTIQLDLPIDLPPEIRARGDRVSDRARDVASAEDLDAAARAFARLLATCGDCHRAARTAWEWPEVPMPEGDDLEPRMRRHAWATERMWEALIVASPERFDRAAAALDVAPLTGEVAPDEEEPAGLRTLEERLREAAHSAASATTMEERAALYGAILGSCARCHDAVRDAAISRSGSRGT